MFKAIYELKNIGEFSSLKEAFKAIYDAIRAEKVLMWQMLETTIWIEHGRDMYPFYEARDIMCKAGYLVDGEWVEPKPCHPKCKTCAKLRTPKPLAQYLFEHDCEYADVRSSREYFQQALDAYESTENVTIKIERK